MKIKYAEALRSVHGASDTRCDCDEYDLRYSREKNSGTFTVADSVMVGHAGFLESKYRL
jgi:hypothetical protein